MMLAFYPLSLSDAAVLQAACWPELSLVEAETRVKRFTTLQEKNRAFCIVARRDSEVVGFGQLVRWVHSYEICDLIVPEAYRGQGIGSALIQRLTKIAGENNIPTVEIGGALSNPRALTLYRRLGFEEAHHRFLDLGDGPEPVLYLQLQPEKETQP